MAGGAEIEHHCPLTSVEIQLCRCFGEGTPKVVVLPRARRNAHGARLGPDLPGFCGRHRLLRHRPRHRPDPAAARQPRCSAFPSVGVERAHPGDDRVGYRRGLGPGVPVQASLIPHVNPITFAINLIKSIPVGIDHVLAELGVGRALGITPSGPYGVGGPQLPAPPATTMTTMSTLSASEAAEPDAPQVDSPAKAAPSAEPVAAEAVAGTRKATMRKPCRPRRIPRRRLFQSLRSGQRRRGRSRNRLRSSPIDRKCAGRSSSTYKRRRRNRRPRRPRNRPRPARHPRPKTASDSTNSPGSENKDAA